MTWKKATKLTINEINYNDAKKNILADIEEVKMDLDECKNYFQLVDEPLLIDYAIYKESALKLKYAYLLDRAKQLDIKVRVADMQIDKEYVE